MNDKSPVCAEKPPGVYFSRRLIGIGLERFANPIYRRLIFSEAFNLLPLAMCLGPR